MNKQTHPYILALLPGLLLLSLGSCKSYKDEPALKQTDISGQVYKVPEGKPLTSDEQNKLKETQDEYKQNAQ